MGLSPRVRGNPLSGSGSDSCRGSIPARAGEPRNPCSGHVTHTVYPPHCLKSNVTELRSHKVSWQIQPRNARWLASVVGKTRRNASANLFWAFVMSALHLIDTRRGSPKGHYVNHSVRAIRPPARWRISPPHFEPSRLRMRHIIRPQIILPAIQCNPDATHSVAAVLCGAARPSGRF